MSSCALLRVGILTLSSACGFGGLGNYNSGAEGKQIDKAFAKLKIARYGPVPKLSLPSLIGPLGMRGGGVRGYLCWFTKLRI